MDEPPKTGDSSQTNNSYTCSFAEASLSSSLQPITPASSSSTTFKSRRPFNSSLLHHPSSISTSFKYAYIHSKPITQLTLTLASDSTLFLSLLDTSHNSSL